MKSLMLKMMVIFGVMVFAVCVTFLTFSVYSSSKNLSEVAEESLLAIRDAWSIGISDVVEAEKLLLETIARRTTLVDETFTMEQRLSYLEADLEAGKDIGYLNFSLIAPDGIMYTTDGSILDVSDQPHFTVPMRGESYVSDPFISRGDSTNGQLIQVTSVPLMVNNSPVGVLLLRKDGYSLTNLVIELEKNINGSGMLASMETGEFVAHLEPARVTANILEEAKTNSQIPRYEAMILNLMRGETGIAEYTYKGEERLGLYQPIPGTNWGLIVFNRVANINARTDAFTTAMTIFSIIILALALTITYFIARNISLPIRYATEQIQYFSEGDLSFENKLQNYRTQKDEIGIIARSLHTLQKNVSRVFKDIISAAEQVANGSQQISTSSQSVSSVASEQAAATEEVSSTMEEMASNIKQNADNATKTGSISKQAVENAHMGKQAVNEALEAVKKIASEVSVVSGIASQINLLALNAAIEAARAGDAGKGFAVVASEVRKLAEKSQIAATEINGLSTKTIIVAERADEVITSVIPGIEQTASLIEEISFASREQDTGAQQVNKAIVQMDVGVQQNASSSEELASMAEELSSQAMQLIDILKFFTLAEESDQRQAPSQKPIKKTTVAIPKQEIKKESKKPSMATSTNGIGKQNYTSSSNSIDSDFEEF